MHTLLVGIHHDAQFHPGDNISTVVGGITHAPGHAHNQCQINLSLGFQGSQLRGIVAQNFRGIGNSCLGRAMDAGYALGDF